MQLLRILRRMVSRIGAPRRLSAKQGADSGKGLPEPFRHAGDSVRAKSGDGDHDASGNNICGPLIGECGVVDAR